MNIGLMNLEPQIPNSAMMQVSQYHKNRGDQVYDYNPLFDYDKTYVFSLFDFTDKSLVPPNAICGGTGFDITSKLPREIEESDLDYSIFLDCNYSMIWFSRGCFRNCPFCVVRQKEGNIHPVKPKNLNPNGEFIKVMDNNFFGNPKWKKSVQQLLKWNQPVDIQGFDIRIFDEEQGEALQRLKHRNNIKFAWDNPKDNLDDKIEELLNWVKPHKLRCYVLIGFWSTQEEDLHRVMHMWDEYKIPCFAMPYDKNDTYQRRFARWCNNQKIFKKTSWGDYIGSYKREKGNIMYGQKRSV